MAALFDFFRKFPEYKNHDLWLSGESYAGVYVPYLAWRIDNHNAESQFKINLKGIIVGNGVTNWRWDGDPAYVEMAYYHGLYSQEYWMQLKKNKCNFEYIDVISNQTRVCHSLWEDFLYNYTYCINMYDVYETNAACITSDQSNINIYGESIVGNQTKRYRRKFTSKDYTPWMFGKLMFEGQEERVNHRDFERTHHAFGSDALTDWLNREDVRRALHIPDNLPAWDQCNEDRHWNYKAGFNGSVWIYPILKNKYRILFYSGTVDGAVPTRGSREWINDLGWNITEKWRPYFIRDQLVGYIEQRDGMTFTTIHGAGHMAPQQKREEAFYIVFNWLKGIPI